MASIETMFMGLILGFALVFLLFLLGSIFFTMGPEGRFMMGRWFRRAGIDLLSYQRLSQELSLTKIKYDGKYWIDEKNNAIMSGIDPVKGTDPEDEQYNKAIASTARWKGNRRPVLWATEEMFFAFSHGFLDLATRASKFQEYIAKLGKKNTKKDAVDAIKADYDSFINEIGKVKKHIQDSDEYQKCKPFMAMLLTQVEMGYRGLKIQTIITADEINKYLEGATPRILMEAREEGKTEGALEMTMPEKKEGLPPMVKAIAISASLIMALVIAYVAITGKNPITGIKDVLPN